AGGAHCDGVVKLAERAAPEVRGPNPIEWVHRLDAEIDNIRTALQWASEQGDEDSQLRIVAALWDFWWMRGFLSEAQRWAEEAVSRSRVVSSVRGRALNAAGTVAGVRGEFDRAEAWLRESVAVFRE